MSSIGELLGAAFAWLRDLIATVRDWFQGHTHD